MPPTPPPEPPEPSPESLFASWLARRELGEEVELEELCRAHPEAAERLRSLHGQLEELEEIRRRFGLAGSLGERLRSRYDERVDPQVELEGEGEEDFTSQVLGRLSGRTPASSRYRLKGEVASGGMGAILRVWDEDLRRHLAMKVVLGKGRALQTGGTPPVDRRMLARFLEEAQVTGQLEHPGIVPVHELGLDAAGRAYFTMKLVRGRDLRAILELVRAGREGWTQVKAVGVLHRVCEAMSYAHDKGVVHRDLKPANVMVGRYGEVYVMDWGLARILGRADDKDLRLRVEDEQPLDPVGSDRRDARGETPLLTLDGDVVGTPAYMPPEQARGELEAIGPLSDVYAVGAMLYHLLAGWAPFVRPGDSAGDLAIWRRVIKGPPEALAAAAPGAPAELVAICDKAMAREPRERYASMDALAADLSAYLEGRVVGAYETGPWAEARKWVQRNRGWAASIAAALILLLGLSAAYSQQLAGKNRDLLAEQRRTSQANELLRASNLSLAAESARANEATAEARRRLAESLVREAAVAGTRGRWRDVLGLMAQAREAGFPDEVALQLEEARAHMALMERGRARELVEALARREDLGGHRGRVLLMQGDLALRETDDSQAALALVRSALEEPLPDADRAYAEGLLAETTPDALAAFERALEHDPFHFRALGQALQLQALLGRFDQAAQREQAFRELCPEDPMPDAVAALVAGLSGDRERAEALAEAVRSKSSDATGDAMSSLVEMAAELRAGCTLERLIGASSGGLMAGLLTKHIPQMRLVFRSLPLDALLLTSVRAGLGSIADTLTGVAFPGLVDSRRQRERLERSFAIHPDGFLLFLQGGHEMYSPASAPEEYLAKTVRAEACYRRAVEVASVFPDVQRAARFLASYAQVILARNKVASDDRARAQFTRNAFALAAAPDLLRHECAILVDQAIERLDDPLLCFVLLRRWQELGPPDPGYYLRLGRTLLQAGAYERAVSAADDALALDPLDEGAANLRRDSLAAARQALAALE